MGGEMRRVVLHEQLRVFAPGARRQMNATQDLRIGLRRECPGDAPLAGATSTFQRNDGALTRESRPLLNMAQRQLEL
jgi:hypothetical protein